MKTNSTLSIFLLAQASALSYARAFIMASMVGCAGAYTPPPQAGPPQAMKQEPLVKSNPQAQTFHADQSDGAAITTVLSNKSLPITTHLTEVRAPNSSALVASNATQSAEPAQELAATQPVESEQLQPKAAPMLTHESIESPATPPQNQTETQLQTQTEIQPATTTPVSREPGAAARQNLVLERAHTSHAQIVLLGDSITEGWEGAPEQLQALVGLRSAANLGVGGDRTQHVLWRLEQAPLSAIKPKVIVLMIGTNNIYDDSANDIIAGIHAVVELLSAQCPNAEILVLDIPPRGDVQDSAREKIAQINIGLTLGMWPQHARFVRVSNQFLKPDGPIDPVIMPDLLHFSQKGYALWAAAIKPELDCSLAANHPEPAPTTPHP